MKNNKLLSYYELRKLIDESKCILNDETLDYLESLLTLDVSALGNNNDSLRCKFLRELEMYKSLVLYNLYNSSLKLIDKNTVINEYFNRLNFSVKYQNIDFNIYSLDFSDVPNIYLYKSNSDLESIDCKQIDFLVPYAREAILERFLSRNKLKISDFDDEKDLYGNCYKIKKYGYSNIYIK